MNKTYTALITASALVALPACSEAPAEQQGLHSNNTEALRILPLGDSITQADSNNYSYRYWLWQMLNALDTPTDFVGSLDTNFKGSPNFSTDFDPNHEGHWGWRVDEVLEQLPEWLTQYNADVAIVFSTLGPTTWHGAECLTAINQALPALQDKLDTSNARSLLVEPHQTLEISDLYDGLHPNETGERKIASAWLEAIQSLTLIK